MVEQAKVKSKEDRKYFDGVIPRTNEGKVDWKVFVPDWMLVKLSGGTITAIRMRITFA